MTTDTTRTATTTAILKAGFETRQEFIDAYVFDKAKAAKTPAAYAEAAKAARAEARKQWNALTEDEKGSKKRGSRETFWTWLEEAPRSREDFDNWMKNEGTEGMRKAPALEKGWELAQKIWAKVPSTAKKAA